ADGLAALARSLGLGRDYASAQGRRLTACGQHIRFLREQHAGAPFYLRAGVLSVDAEGLTIYQEMVDTVSGDVTAAFTLELALRESATHAACSLPRAVQDAAARLHIERPEHGRAKGLSMQPPRTPMTLYEAEAMGLIPTFQAQVHPEQCDSAGRLTLRHFMGTFSNAVPNLLGQTSGCDRARMLNVGGASLEFRFVYHRYP